MFNKNYQIIAHVFSNPVNRESQMDFEMMEKVIITASGDNIPSLLKSFDNYGLNHLLSNNVKLHNIAHPNPIQEYLLPIIKQKRNIFCFAGPNSGKTVGYLIPMLNQLFSDDVMKVIGKPVSIIIVPNCECAIKVYETATKLVSGSNMNLCIAYTGSNTRFSSKSKAAISPVIIATPGPLLDLCDQQIISLENTQYLVFQHFEKTIDKVNNYNDSIELSLSVNYYYFYRVFCLLL
jgi:superfamily II DNA/RNA helicase